MIMYNDSTSITTLSTALYHMRQKPTQRAVNPPFSLLLTYLVAAVLRAFLPYFKPARRGILAEARQVNWASVLPAVSIVGLEVGFILVNLSGWSIGPATFLANVAASLALVPVALFVFEDVLKWIDIVGGCDRPRRPYHAE
jgi:hypothetical protein